MKMAPVLLARAIATAAKSTIRSSPAEPKKDVLYFMSILALNQGHGAHLFIFFDGVTNHKLFTSQMWSARKDNKSKCHWYKVSLIVM